MENNVQHYVKSDSPESKDEGVGKKGGETWLTY